MGRQLSRHGHRGVDRLRHAGSNRHIHKHLLLHWLAWHRSHWLSRHSVHHRLVRNCVARLSSRHLMGHLQRQITHSSIHIFFYDYDIAPQDGRLREAYHHRCVRLHCRCSCFASLGVRRLALLSTLSLQRMIKFSVRFCACTVGYIQPSELDGAGTVAQPRSKRSPRESSVNTSLVQQLSRRNQGSS
jgi:hypothetical protein